MNDGKTPRPPTDWGWGTWCYPAPGPGYPFYLIPVRPELPGAEWQQLPVDSRVWVVLGQLLPPLPHGPAHHWGSAAEGPHAAILYELQVGSHPASRRRSPTPRKSQPGPALSGGEGAPEGGPAALPASLGLDRAESLAPSAISRDKGEAPLRFNPPEDGDPPQADQCA